MDVQTLADTTLAREHRLLVEAVEVADGAIAIYDQSEKLIACNARYRDLHDRGFRSLRGAADVHYGDLMRATLRGGLPNENVEQMVAERIAAHRAADGTPRDCFYQGKGWFRVSKTRTPGGAIVGIATDITALKTSEAEAARARARAEEALAARGRFVATLCHELRNPLNAMIGIADQLSGALDAGAEVAALRNAGHEMVSILNDVLDHARIDRGALHVDPAPVDIAGLVDELAALYGPWAARGGLALHIDTDRLATPRVIADRRLIYQIAGNLLANAVKFTRRGGILLAAATREDGDGLRLELAVEDTGPGLTAGEIDRLFAEFAQLGPAGSGEVTGSGLGLSIARARAEAMGGELGVSSVPGKGSRFTLLLPVAAAPEAQPPARTLRVLAAEDNEINRMVLQGMLARLPVELTLVEDGGAAVAAAQPGAFDVILMDSQMPTKDGLTAVREIRAAEVMAGARPARIVSISASAADDYAAEAMAAGVNLCIDKPLSAEALREAVLAGGPDAQ